MKIDDAAGKRKIELALEATSKGKIFFSAHAAKDEFNRGCEHVCRLLLDSHLLYSAGSFSTSAFLSITTIEEIAKLDIAVHRTPESTAPAKRRDDVLFSHRAKHSIALQEVIAIGTRLPKAIGEGRVRKLLDMAESGELIAQREAALYTDNVGGKFTCPADRIGKEMARELLLLALEVWDDRLVGLTSHTYEIDSRLGPLFSEVAKS